MEIKVIKSSEIKHAVVIVYLNVGNLNAVLQQCTIVFIVKPADKGWIFLIKVISYQHGQILLYLSLI